MICFNCLKVYPLSDTVQAQLTDDKGKTLKTVCICESCAKEFIKAIINGYFKDSDKIERLL